MDAFRDEVLKSLEAQLRRHNDHLGNMLRVLRDSNDTHEEMLSVLKDLKRVLTVKSAEDAKELTVQQETLAVLRDIKELLAR